MTVNVDPYANKVQWLIQESAANVLQDYSRHAWPITGTYAADAANTLFARSSFTGIPELPPAATELGFSFTIEAWLKFGSGVLVGASSTASGIYNEWDLRIAPPSNAKGIGFYAGARTVNSQESFFNSNNATAYPASTAGFKHFFMCMNHAQNNATAPSLWWGYNGTMTRMFSSADGVFGAGWNVGPFPGNFYGNLTGAAGNPPAGAPSSNWKLRIGNMNSAISGFNLPYSQRIHSVMCTSEVIRYPNQTGAGGTYTIPDDLFTNWYSDSGAANDKNFIALTATTAATLIAPVRVPATNAAAVWNGDSTIAGHVTYNGANAAKRVLLFDRASMRQIAVATSDATTGAFAFGNLTPLREYLVIGVDDTPGTINAEIADHLIPA